MSSARDDRDVRNGQAGGAVDGADALAGGAVDGARADSPASYIKPSEIKVIMLGESSVGKTCLVKRLVTKSFVDNTDVTFGAAYAPYIFKVGDEEIKMGIWDTAGSERFRSFISTYFRQAKAAIICYNMDDVDTFEKIKYWVDSVRQHEETCAMYICGTKADLITSKNKGEITHDMVESIAKELKTAGVYETSSKTGQNVESLFKMIGEDFIKSVKPADIDGLVRNGSDTVHLTDDKEHTNLPGEKKAGKFECC